MFEHTHPKTLMKWLIVAGLVYFLVPYDLLPDFLGFPGRIDDLVIMAWLAWFYRKHIQQYVERAGLGTSSAKEVKNAKAFDAHDVLGVSPSASHEAIQTAYRARMKEYHPDKVAHLGEELQKLANEKSQDIQRAYRQLGG